MRKINSYTLTETYEEIEIASNENSSNRHKNRFI